MASLGAVLDVVGGEPAIKDFPAARHRNTGELPGTRLTTRGFLEIEGQSLPPTRDAFLLHACLPSVLNSGAL